jgi:hypothetical protein
MTCCSRRYPSLHAVHTSGCDASTASPSLHAIHTSGCDASTASPSLHAIHTCGCDASTASPSQRAIHTSGCDTSAADPSLHAWVGGGRGAIDVPYWLVASSLLGRANPLMVVLYFLNGGPILVPTRLPPLTR